MSMNALEQAIGLIEKTTTARFHGRKSEELIGAGERALGLTFPPTYRVFLSQFGCGDIAGHEFYGIVDDDFENSSVPDAVWLTLDERRSSELPKSMIVVESIGDGGYYAIDRSLVNADGDSPIIEWWPGFPDAAGNRRIVAEDFGSFLLGRISAVQ
jgi:hypothetical protein